MANETVKDQAQAKVDELEASRDSGELDGIETAEVVDESGALVPLSGSTIATVPDLLAAMQSMAVQDSEQVAMSLALKKLQARNPDELNAIGTLHTIDELLNQVVIVDAVRWNESRIEGSRGAYVVFDAANVYTGETATYGTGHMDVMIVLWKLQEWDLLPSGLKITQAANNNRFGKPVYLAEIVKPEDLPQRT